MHGMEVFTISPHYVACMLQKRRIYKLQNKRIALNFFKKSLNFIFLLFTTFIACLKENILR